MSNSSDPKAPVTARFRACLEIRAPVDPASKRSDYEQPASPRKAPCVRSALLVPLAQKAPGQVDGREKTRSLQSMPGHRQSLCGCCGRARRTCLSSARSAPTVRGEVQKYRRSDPQWSRSPKPLDRTEHSPTRNLAPERKSRTSSATHLFRLSLVYRDYQGVSRPTPRIGVACQFARR